VTDWRTWLAVACPFCDAAAGEPCRRPSGQHTSEPHSDRTRAAQAEVAR
jgi:hypothetical protein